LIKAGEASVKIQALSERVKETLDETDHYLNEYIPVIKHDLATAETAIKEVSQQIKQIYERENTLDELLVKVESRTETIDQVIEMLQLLEKVLRSADEEATDDGQLSRLIIQLEADYEQLEKTKQDLQAMIYLIENTPPTEEHPAIDDEKSLEQLKAMVELMDVRQKSIKHVIDASYQVENAMTTGAFLEWAEKVA